MKKLLCALLAVCMLAGCLCGCAGGENPGTSGSSGSSGLSGSSSGGNTSGTPAEVDFSQTDEDMFTKRDSNTDIADAVQISLNGDSASCAASGVNISGTTVTITAEGSYALSGTLQDGMIVVNVADTEKVQLVLNGVDIYSETGAPICVLEADKVFITLVDGSENILKNGEVPGTVGEYTVDAVIYCRSDLTINGSGKLSITAPASHGISCKDDLAITGGNISVTCANQALDANDSIRICGGTFTLDAGKDGIHAENNDDASEGFVYISGGSFSIEAEGDGISAGYYMQIEGGSFTLLCGGGYENGSSSSDGWGNMGGMGGRPGSSSSSSSSDDSTSMKGFKAAGGLLISDGTFVIDSADDAIHSDASVTINGGTFTIASGDDAVHAEDTLTITACTMEVTDCYEGLEGEKIYVQGGSMILNCSDDGLNASGGTDSSGTTGGRDGMFGGGMGGGMSGSSANATIEVSGGYLRIYAGGDGLDSNGNLTISGGYTIVFNPKSGDTSVLDSQNAPVITGGTYIGFGITTSMAETFSSSSTQGVIACTTGTQSAGAEVTITDSDGNVILQTATEYKTVLMIVSTPDMVKGESYTITIGSVSGTLNAS